MGSFWAISAYLVLILYVFVFVVVIAWPPCKGRDMLLGYFGIQIGIKICYVLPGLTQFADISAVYGAMNVIGMASMLLLIGGLLDIGKRIVADVDSGKDDLERMP